MTHPFLSIADHHLHWAAWVGPVRVSKTKLGTVTLYYDPQCGAAWVLSWEQPGAGSMAGQTIRRTLTAGREFMREALANVYSDNQGIK